MDLSNGGVHHENICPTSGDPKLITQLKCEKTQHVSIPMKNHPIENGDLCNGRVHGNLCPTTSSDPLENGDFSPEKARKGEKIVNENFLNDDEEVSERFAHENHSTDNSNPEDHGGERNPVSPSESEREIRKDSLENDVSTEGIAVVDSKTNNSNDADYISESERENCNGTQENDVSTEDIAVVDSKTHGGDVNTTSPANDVSEEKKNGVGDVSVIIPPHCHLPKPEAPPGVTITCSLRDSAIKRSKSLPETTHAVDVPAIGKFFREKSNSLSAAITKHLSLSSLKEDNKQNDVASLNPNVTEFNLSGLKVVVRLKTSEFKGRITFFSRSNCRDCTAVRSFFREKNLKYVEINLDVYPMREKELIEKTGSAVVPQIFFNEKLFGGLVALNSMRNSGVLEQKMKELLGSKCPDDAPAVPVYGFDDEVDEEEEKVDDLVVKVLRQRLPIQDRLMKMKIVKNCFSGAEMVELLIHFLDCGRNKAIEIGRQLARKHFIHHVFGENEFEDGNHFYRFLEHEPFIPRCFNFRGPTNDSEPKAAALVSLRLAKLMSAILESYASDDRRHLDYVGISNSEEFRRYVNLVQDLHRVNILALSLDEKLAFFLNLYNAMVIHAVISVGPPGGVIDRRSFYSDFLYVVGGHPYSLTTIKNGILRNNRRAPYSLVKPFGTRDKRLELGFLKVNQLIHFGLCDGTRSSPTVRFFTPQGVESELRHSVREFFQRDGIEVDLARRTIYLTRIIKWFNVDFGQEREIPKWILNYLDATKAGLLTHLLGDGGPVNIVYQNFDWSVNS